MSSYKAVTWNRNKLIYDAVAIAGVVLYIQVYLHFGAMAGRDGIAPDDATLSMKAFGSCAFVLLTGILSIGPLARLDRRFLPLLYNRRHLGVLTCTVAAGHVASVLSWYFAYSDLPPLRALLVADTSVAQLAGFAFVILGIGAFIILLVLAATSHDFWLAFLGPRIWKAIHMAVYAAYALVIGHIAFGALQDARSSALAIVCGLSAATLVTLHLLAGRQGAAKDGQFAPAAATTPWVTACDIAEVREGRGFVVKLADGEPVAIFRHQGRLSAVSNLCAHQNGPLGEGRIVDGCITCPWHGFQYRLEDGCSPPPFTERISTYRLKLDGRCVLLDPRPNPPGTHVAAVTIPPAYQASAP
jgi:nitrite reductase/ring-hydroxylating ferredoxin subunit/DMSO/TMAO reductase YedYZ heme-binding membrane subunit